MKKSEVIFDWVIRAAHILKDAGFENSLFEARFLVAVSVNKSLSWVLSHPYHLIETERAENYLARRLMHEPLAYIAGKREFWGRDFTVDSRVLIPRQETEELIAVCLELLSLTSAEHVLDLCTGSGCIGITLKLERPCLNVVGSDIDSTALEVAQANSIKLGTDIQWYCGDLFSFQPKNKFDLIVCNPPYISYEYILQKEVAIYEPSHALWAEENGIYFYDRLAVESIMHLNENGKIVLEVGKGQANRVKNIFQLGPWKLHSSRMDLSKIERCLVFKLKR